MKEKIIVLAKRDLKKAEISLKRAQDRPNTPKSELEHLEELLTLRMAILQMCEDASKLVRCKDCVYRMQLSPSQDCMVCFCLHRPTSEDGYCYEGIRRES